MADVPSNVLNWLYSVLTPEYRDVNRTYSHVAETLKHFQNWRPRTDVYTYENGESALLLTISGTIPVQFRGTVYRFPIALWIPHTYPHAPPIVYVTPSQDQLVRPGQHVSAEGTVYHPYLAQWAKYWDKSSILDFLSVLRSVFAKEPPVISKQHQQQANTVQTPQAPPPVPPPPEEWRRSAQVNTPPASTPQPGLSGPPPRPPKDYQGQQQNSNVQSSQHSQTPSRTDDGPPLPPLPHEAANRYSSPQQWQRPPTQGFPNGSQYPPPNPGFQAGHPQPPPPQQPRPAQYELGSPVSPLNAADQSSRSSQPLVPPQQQYQGHPQQWPPPQAGPPPPQGQQPPRQYAQPAAPPQYYPQNQQQPKPRQPIVDLMDSPLEVTLPSQTGQNDPVVAPPIPPNPEKDALLQALSNALCSKTSQAIAENTAAIGPLQAQQQALRQAYAHLQGEVEQMQQLDAALASNESVIHGAMHEADRVMEEARTRQVPEVDDVLVVPTVVGGQLYNLCAEERALTDAMFVLGRALDKGRIGAELFAKQTRSLAREQYLKKALIKKIADGMGLEQMRAR